MSLPPVTLDDLTQAVLIDPANDLMLIRQGLQDKKATVDQISGVNFSTFSEIPTSLAATDRILVARPVGSGFVNYWADLKYFAFPVGTKMYFAEANPPLGWDLDVSVQDRLLAVRGPAGTTYANYGLAGTWQQPSYALTPQQIPPHVHKVPLAFGSSSSDSSTSARAGTNNQPQTKCFTSNGATGIGGAAQLLGQGHNHGNTWRIAATVGSIGIKS